ncbi:LexA family transcriptional regulator [Devosia ginsengisoli]|uniref:Helix-turn-helix domain-containing protein n=1 Tax=Devosia ginsengisoli TaxID=400770 RepID=A0A5B8LTF1_9HYPH|nr:LexA family transcriptional regulator [Devosia ginsengisoli]QDZ10550.1 helix-turn-helix domain-containing protein [Devosia ginsengisoli]
MAKFPNHLRDFRIAAGLSQPELAKAADTNVQNVSRIELGERKLTQEWAAMFARHLGTTAQQMMFPDPEVLARVRSKKPVRRELDRVPLDEAWTPTSEADGEGYDRDSYEPKIEGAIPELDARAGGGEGAVGEVMVLPVGNGTISAHKILDEWRIPPSYLREAVANPDRAIVLGIQGDSMMPNYAPGDRVIIDLTEHELRADGVYLISDGFSEPQIKRLQRVLFAVPPKCRIISDNPSYEAQEVDVDGVKILGKVAAYVGRR